MKMMTVVLKYEDDDAMPPPLSLKDEVLGGRVTALAFYDVIHTMGIAEDVITESSEDACIKAVERINSHIIHGTYTDLSGGDSE